jgi:hypothetical protein
VAKVLGKWKGSRVIGTSKGAIYYIRKRLGGKPYEMSRRPWLGRTLDCGRAARSQVASPERYCSGPMQDPMVPRPPPPRLDAATLECALRLLAKRLHAVEIYGAGGRAQSPVLPSQGLTPFGSRPLRHRPAARRVRAPEMSTRNVVFRSAP